MMPAELHEAIAASAGFVRARLPEGWSPRVAVILGSGLGTLADEVERVAVISYADIPGFGTSSVAGHAGQLVLGALEGTPVVMMQGRYHFYEGYTLQHTTFPVRVMQALGADTLVATNAAGGLNPEFRTGDLMLITDHINMLGWGGQNPLIGPNDPSLGPRFPPMIPAYDPGLIEVAMRSAAECNISLRQGVYLVLAGPNFETRAELRLLRQWGADAVGMSTVPEVIVALHGGMRVLGISAITNQAFADGDQAANHEEVLEVAELIRPKFVRLMKRIVERLNV